MRSFDPADAQLASWCIWRFEAMPLRFAAANGKVRHAIRRSRP